MELDVAVRARPKRARRFRTPEERCRIVEETLVPGVSVATVARAHEVNANLVFQWRKLYHAGMLSRAKDGEDGSRMLPVTVSSPDADTEPMTEQTDVRSTASSGNAATGAIELTLSKAQVRIAGVVDTATLRVVLDCLLR